MLSGEIVSHRHPAVTLAVLVAVVLAACSSRPQANPPEAVQPQVAPPAGQDTGALIRPVDAGSLADLPGYAPINFGHHYVYAVSPDGRTLAAVTWPTGRDNNGGSLRFLDLSSWTDRVAGVTFDSYVNGLVFSADGKAVYWSKSTGTGGGHGLPRDFQLYRYKIDSGKVTVLTRFSPSFQPVEMRTVRSGHRLAVYGIPTDLNNLAEDSPHVLLVDLDGDRLLTDLRISGLVDGQKRVPISGTEQNPYREYVAGRAWDTQNERLYIVHPDVDRITVVDLAAGTILKQGSVRPRVSFLDRLWNHLVLPVEAKLNPGADYQVTLSGDGARIYLTGMRREMIKQPNGGLLLREVPLGLRIVSTGDLTELHRFDFPVSTIAVSPDGRRLLASGARLEAVSGSRGDESRAESTSSMLPIWNWSPTCNRASSFS